MNKTDRHNITEILLKMVLNTITLTHLVSVTTKKREMNYQYVVYIYNFCSHMHASQNIKTQWNSIETMNSINDPWMTFDISSI
jgi:hypothetical protein